MLARLRSGFVPATVAVALALAAATGCGEASKATVSFAASAQRITSYVRALERIMGPLHDFPRHPNDAAEAQRVLQTATRRLTALIPPQEFLSAHDELLTSLRAQLDLIPVRQRALRAHDVRALRNITAEDVRQQDSIRTALEEATKELELCRGEGFVC